jgi:hypothetical protein
VVKGWDYAELVAAYEKAGTIAREQHIPVLVHVTELHSRKGILLRVHMNVIKAKNA